MAQEKDVKINDRVFHIREMLAKEFDEIDFNDSKKAVKMQVMISSGITEKEYDELTFRERLTLQKEINELNGIGPGF